MASVAILTLSAASARAFTNYLANPGLETGNFTGWTDTYAASHSVDSTAGYVYGSGTIHEPAHSGTWALKMWGDYWGNFVQTHTAYQLIPAASGSTWSADVWAYTASPDNIQGANYAQLQVFFYDATTNEVLADAAANYSAVVNTSTPINTWIHLIATNTVDGTTNLNAPAGTAFVRFGIMFSQDAAESGGSTYFDDANLIKTASTDPEISGSPQNLTVVYGQTATFTVLASGKTTLSYAWQDSGNPVNNGGRISGATTSTLTISNATTADEGYYTVTVTDNAGSLTSPSGGTLTVLDPGIMTNPVSAQKIAGQSVTFTVSAAGSGTLTYAWYNSTGQLNNGSRISGANTPALTISNLTVADSGSYYVIVTGVSAIQSPSVSLSVGTVAQASELMLNGGFETGDLTWWTSWNGVGVETASPGAGETNYDGNYICEIWGTGAGTYNGINQSSDTRPGFAPQPGYVYKANAWFLQSAGAPITDTATAWLEVNFYTQGNLIGNFKSAIISSNSPVGVWTNLVVPYAVAPAGADEVRCQINYLAGNVGGGEIFVDDVSCWLRIPVTITPSVTNANLLLSFPSQIGVTNYILYKNNLTDPTWQLLTNWVGDLSGQAAIPTSKTVPSRFYRVNTP
jgi:hypothetical protein